MKNYPTAIRLEHITKVYTVHHEKPTLVEKFVKDKNETFFALKDLSVEIKRGERVGLVGPNGSGKTTLLKIISGITSPTTGTVNINGNVISLIDLEAGFHSDLTGEQNIFLNAMILGMSRNEIKKKLNHIIAFADIGQFIDAPLFTYSQGMKLRLGFAVAIYADPDILILDEGLGAGDDKFQKKSAQKIQEFSRQGKTILVATHWREFIKKVCSRVIILNKGIIASDK